ncbi:MAG TPA: hypothetical protein VHZ24_17680 [Pirellulales bacterium]|jgi:hypothetical protein|nr:hypothetical protein [Pirellulales bacterium]
MPVRPTAGLLPVVDRQHGRETVLQQGKTLLQQLKTLLQQGKTMLQQGKTGKTVLKQWPWNAIASMPRPRSIS